MVSIIQCHYIAQEWRALFTVSALKRLWGQELENQSFFKQGLCKEHHLKAGSRWGGWAARTSWAAEGACSWGTTMYLLVSRVISENHCFFLEKKKKHSHYAVLWDCKQCICCQVCEGDIKAAWLGTLINDTSRPCLSPLCRAEILSAYSWGSDLTTSSFIALKEEQQTIIYTYEQWSGTEMPSLMRNVGGGVAWSFLNYDICAILL